MNKLIAVYGSLRKEFHNNHVMGNSKLLGIDRITGFKMYSLGSYPAIIKGKGDISIEVFEVADESTLKRIYQLEGYSGVRDSSDNWYDTTDVETKFGKAELFYMKDENAFNDRPIVEDGVWKQTRMW